MLTKSIGILVRIVSRCEKMGSGRSTIEMPLENLEVMRSATRVFLMLALMGAMVSVARTCDSADPNFPSELVEFGTTHRAAVFEPAAAGSWDAAIRERGWIERDESGWHLWYTGYDGTSRGIRRVGYATSSDGITWSRPFDRPLVDNIWIEDMMVVRRGSAWYMFAEGWQDRAQLLISVDRIHWQRICPLDIRQTDGEPIPPGPFGTPTVWIEEDTWYLFYERSDQGVWLATSQDLVTWTNISDDPVLPMGPEEYDSRMIALNQIVRHGDRYYAYYHGSGTPASPRQWNPCLAASEDLIHWTKYTGNPLLPPEANKSSGLLIQDAERFLLYTMHGSVEIHTSSP
jgi:hypothetical protein